MDLQEPRIMLRFPTRRRAPRPSRGVRGMAMLLALVAVGLAVIIGLAVASSRDATTTTSGSIVRGAEMRSASRGALAVADFIAVRHTGLMTGDPNDELREIFEPKQIGTATLTATLQDASTERSPTERTVGVRYAATATIAGQSSTIHAVTRLPWADSVARADLDLSEFALLATEDGSLDILPGSEVSAWRGAPLAELGEPVVIGTSTRSIDAVTIWNDAIMLGTTTVTDGNLPDDTAAADAMLADGLCPLPADIHVPAAPKQAVAETFELVAASDLADAVANAGGTDNPNIRVVGSVTMIADMAVQGTVDAGTWRVIAFEGALTVDGARWIFEVPTMLVATGGVTIQNGAKLEIVPGGALTIVSDAGVTVTESYIGPQLPTPDAQPDADGGAPYGGIGATRIAIFAQPEPSEVLVSEGSVVIGEIYAPLAPVRLDEGSAVYGRILGGSITLDEGRLFYDPALDTGRGWRNAESGVYEGANDVRDAVTTVAALNDESLAAFTQASGIAADLPANGLLVTAHVDAAGGRLADTVANGADGGTVEDASLLPGQSSLVGGSEPVSSYPEVFTISGTVRDFRDSMGPAGHPDFNNPSLANGLRAGLVERLLSSDGKPALASMSGTTVSVPFRDAQGVAICWTLYNGSLGDSVGSGTIAKKKSATSADTFDKWFRDVPGVNLSEPITLTLHRALDASNRVTYVFDSNEAEPFIDDGCGPMLDGFFPIEGRLYGSEGPKTKDGVTRDRNFNFTLELETAFTYKAGTGQTFTFRGDDDVWVFIDGNLVIDLGGTHAPASQAVPLDRLGLVDGRAYPMKLFFAERRALGSNFRIASNFPLSSPLPPPPPADPLESLESILAAQQAVRDGLVAGAYAALRGPRAVISTTGEAP